MIETSDGVINDLRIKRLLLLAQTPNAWHKRFYHQYYWLCAEGLTGWVLGTAYLTEKGDKTLKELLSENSS